MSLASEVREIQEVMVEAFQRLNRLKHSLTMADKREDDPPLEARDPSPIDPGHIGPEQRGVDPQKVRKVKDKVIRLCNDGMEDATPEQFRTKAAFRDILGLMKEL